MAKPRRLSNLDPLVAALADSADFAKHEAGGDVAMLDRLTCSPNMKSVWEQAKTWAEKDAYLPVALLTTALALPRQWRRLSKAPTKEAVAVIKATERTVKLLMRQLDDNHKELQLFVGYDLSLRDLIVDHLRGQSRSTTARRIRKLDWEVHRRRGVGAIPDLRGVLQTLADKLKRAERERPIGGRPTKPGGTSAKRTYCVQQLAAFFDEYEIDVPHNAIARIVTEILDLGANDPLDASHARKLLKKE